jgi:3-keto steroid reductase
VQARFLGSPHHTISTYKAAVSAVQLSLIPLCLIPALEILHGSHSERNFHANGTANGETKYRPTRYCAITDRLGREGVKVNKVSRWEENEDAAAQLLDQFETLYQSLDRK